MPETTTASRELSLPLQAVSRADVSRLTRELAAVDGKLLELGIRSDERPVKMPPTSHLLEETVQLNHLDLLQAADRLALQQFLAAVHQQAPVLHISFSADPAPTFVAKLMVWLRREIHPQVLLTIGLQPNLGAGCIIRGNSRYFDFSLKQDFASKRSLLMAKLSEGSQS